MKVQVETGKLTASLKYCKAKSGVPVKLTADEGLLLDLNDYTTYSQVYTEATVLDPGTVCVDGDLFAKAVNSMSGALELETDGSQLVMNSVLRIGVLGDPPQGFPEYGDELVRLDLAGCLKRTAFAANPKEDGARAVVYLDSDAVVATDGRRLAIYELDSGLPGVPIPAELTKPLLSIGDVGISDSEHHLVFAGETVKLALPKMNIDYPDYRKLIPDVRGHTSAKVVRKDFAELVKRAALATPPDHSTVGVCYLRVLNGQLEVSSRDSSVEYCERIPADTNGEGASSFSYQLLLDFLQQADDVVDVWINDMNPALLACGGYKYVLMPVRV